VQQRVAPPDGLVEVDVERRPLDPLHDEGGVAAAGDEDALREVLEARERRDVVGVEVRVERAVALLAVAEEAAEAAHGQRLARRRRVELEDVGELPRGDERHAEPVHGRQHPAERRLREADGRALHGLRVMPRRRPEVRRGGMHKTGVDSSQ
jgi:hypothetical protein